MSFKIEYHEDVKSCDLPKIDGKIKNIIKRAIEERLATHPEAYGKPLQKTLKGYWKLRVGDYRVIFKMIKNSVFILGIIHRKDVYKFIKKRK